jgi:hypothetical protein
MFPPYKKKYGIFGVLHQGPFHDIPPLFIGHEHFDPEMVPHNGSGRKIRTGSVSGVGDTVAEIRTSHPAPTHQASRLHAQISPAHIFTRRYCMPAFIGNVVVV